MLSAYFCLILALSTSMLPCSGWSQSKVKEQVGHKMSEKYYEGSFLIFNCDHRHWACVDQSSYEDCQGLRKESLQKEYPERPPCAPIANLNTIERCILEQKKLIEGNKEFSFCEAKERTLK